MKLSKDLSHDFPSYIQTRGADYYRSGAVRIEDASDSYVRARVRGARHYEVQIECTPKAMSLWCDCPYFDSTGPCKHVWATILAAEASGHLSSTAGIDRESVTYDYADYEDEEEDPPPIPIRPNSPLVPLPAPKPKPPAWREHLRQVGPTSVRMEKWPPGREMIYVVNVPASITRGLILKIATRELKQAGGYKKLQSPRMNIGTIALLPDAADRHILGLLVGSHDHYDWQPDNDALPLSVSYQLRRPLAETVVQEAAATGRLMAQLDPYEREFVPIAWDSGEPWRFQLRLLRRQDSQCAVTGVFRRGDQEMDIATPVLVTPLGLLFTSDRVARLNDNGGFPWISYLRQRNSIIAPEEEVQDLIAAVLDHPLGVELDLPEDLRLQEVKAVPRPCLIVRAAVRDGFKQERLRTELWFDYEGMRVPDWRTGRGVFHNETRKYLLRDHDVEQAARLQMQQAGVLGPVQEWNDPEPSWRINANKLAGVVHALLTAGWHIEAEGKIFRRPGEVRVSVASGVDWFELHGEVDYGEGSVKLPALLAALRRGENMVRLDDGTYGLLPEQWLERFGLLANLGDSNKDHIRFQRNQVGLLDALLAAQPEISCDATFTAAREALRNFAGVRAAEQPAGFIGQLRDYQREGVGWMEFLRTFSFGGCLADDMGVGKTAQVLALLEQRRALREAPDGNGAPPGPSLVVVPKSLVFNWKQEAARFTPALRVLDHTGTGRSFGSFGDYDLIVTTYGTLRRDAIEFKDVEFDYVVLDEAQAIKNAATESAKAARLLRGRHRLALSGTPIENHLGELWSLFEFLNPGMLGAASVFKLAGNAARNPNEETRRLLAQALRPFFLRRTKQQVARELPPKSEQTIFCEMEPAERKRYNELRAFYRNSLLKTIDTQGLAKSKIQVLEALLRLRQAACHPGLLDPKKTGDSSAKLDVLLDQVQEVAQEGHKALIFSQFTSLLAIVRKRLEDAGIVYEYLDGQTHDRQARVERFQNDPDCGLFLISLKAGGLGLNLTAAEYIFLLDPWWNPAVEAQAIDRAHRIGQTKPVFAYRLIARDTVEEKVLQLQSVKRDLASAIISEDSSLIRNLQREDLELLLS
jgi:superfamily II DNA or RNA helicase